MIQVVEGEVAIRRLALSVQALIRGPLDFIVL